MPDSASILTSAVQRGYTVPELCRRLRVGAGKIRGWIRQGLIAAINTADATSARPRWIITPEALADFEAGRVAQPKQPEAPKQRRPRRQCKDFYPDW